MNTMGERALEEFGDLAQAIVSLAQAHKKTIATAESCTGGLVAAALTSIAGASEAYVGSVVSYANEVKTGLLGVSEDMLRAVGAVSEEVALAMACGACKAVGASYAVSITGVAGPGGGTEIKPVGTVWIGVASEKEHHACLYHFAGTRAQIRQAATEAALQNLLGFVQHSVS
jgi:nicotinamide-nucleotide amidase